MSTHTACSSSLVAMHLAHNGLHNFEADQALASGIFMVLLPGTMAGICQLQALSPVGRCQTFSAAADGYGRGEGCTVAVLQRRCGDGDPVAVVCGTGVNQDGRSSSLTAPNGPAQTALIRSVAATTGAGRRLVALALHKHDESHAWKPQVH
jgi:acyl transferase domain-containing protein